MGALSTATSRNDYRQETFHAKPGLVVPEAKIRADFQKPNIRAKPKRVTETEYWDKYYEHTDAIYEWNNGLLEDKPVSDHENTLMYLWFVELLREFLRVHRVANLTALEMGFRLNLPDKTVIRRPDLGVVLNNNQTPLQPDERSYRGVCDMCIEVISDSKPEEIERDTQTKLGEYEAAGVKEYYILYAKGAPRAFYRLNQLGVYVPIKRVEGDVIQSTVLPGFQFRISDLSAQPSPQEMAFDSVYEKFVMPYYQAEKKALQAEIKAHQAEKKARQAEKKARQAAEQQIKRLEAELARLKKSQ